MIENNRDQPTTDEITHNELQVPKIDNDIGKSGEYPDYQFQIDCQISENCSCGNNVNYSHKKSRKFCPNDFCCHNIVAEECENCDPIRCRNYINLLCSKEGRAMHNATFLTEMPQATISDEFKLPSLKECEETSHFFSALKIKENPKEEEKENLQMNSESGEHLRPVLANFRDENMTNAKRVNLKQISGLETIAEDYPRDEKDDRYLSRTMSLLLRHAAPSSGLRLNKEGYMLVEDVLKYKDLYKYSERDVERIVGQDVKQRFHIMQDIETGRLKVRANQGHSIQVEALELVPILGTEGGNSIIIHGTSRKAWESIKTDGLSRMTRNHIHFTTFEQMEEREKKGIRENKEILVNVDMAMAIRDGFKFYWSKNNVILSPGNQQGRIPPKYLFRGPEGLKEEESREYANGKKLETQKDEETQTENENDTQDFYPILNAIETVKTPEEPTPILEPDFTLSEPLTIEPGMLQRTQRECSETFPLINYLEKRILPKNDEEAREILLKIDQFFLDENVLYHRRTNRSKKIGNLQPVINQICMPQSLRGLVLDHLHTKMAHRGVDRTLAVIQQFYYWPKMAEYTRDFIKYCEPCQKGKAYHIEQAPLRPIEAIAPWHMIQMDVLTVQEAKDGSRFVVVIIDQFSNYSFLYSIKEQTTKALIDCLMRTIVIMGCPRHLYSDTASQFQSRLLIAFCRTMGITRLSGSGHNSRAHGRVENVMRQIWTALRCLCKENDDWPDYLGAIEYSLRSSPIQATALSPYACLFAREMETPLTALILPETPYTHWPDENTQEYVKNLEKRLKIVQDTIIKNREVSNSMMKIRFENEHRIVQPQTYKIGDLVWYREFRIEPGSSKKLNKLFRGPMEIMEIISEQDVRLRHNDTKVVVKGLVAINNIKKAYIREVEDEATNRELDQELTHLPSLNTELNNAKSQSDATNLNKIQIRNEPNASRNELAQQQNDDTLQPSTITEGESREGCAPHQEKPQNSEGLDKSESEPIEDDTLYAAEKILAQKTINGEVCYKIRWSKIGDKSFPDSWTRGDGVGEELKEHFYKTYTKLGFPRKKPLK